MRKRQNGSSSFEVSHKIAQNLEGEILIDIRGKQWKLGEVIGRGAFGMIYMISEESAKDVRQCSYVAKLEFHTSGPLFVEINFYLRVARKDNLLEWCNSDEKFIGLPHYISSGSFVKDAQKYRFLIIPRYGDDLGKMLGSHGHTFNMKTVLSISMQIIDALEFMHDYGYIHGDVKASNILTQQSVRQRRRRKTRVKRQSRVDDEANRIYLVDFGLASKYLLSNGEHRSDIVDERIAHAGTIQFCSQDAHNGIVTRRSDLECLGFNIIYWLTGSLPWMQFVDNYEKVRYIKQVSMSNMRSFLHNCFGQQVPLFLHNYFDYVTKLEFDEAPNYDFCRMLLIDGYLEYGYDSTILLDFENTKGNGFVAMQTHNCENRHFEMEFVHSKTPRLPLKSNPTLRNHSVKTPGLTWSQILTDPERILKSGRILERENEESLSLPDALANLNIHELNPTQTMLDVYRNFMRKQNDDNYVPKIDCPLIEGYNATMMRIYAKMQKKSSVRKRHRVKSETRKNGDNKVKVVVAPLRKYNTRSSTRREDCEDIIVTDAKAKLCRKREKKRLICDCDT